MRASETRGAEVEGGGHSGSGRLVECGKGREVDSTEFLGGGGIVVHVGRLTWRQESVSKHPLICIEGL